jgi:hypothetical protein
MAIDFAKYLSLFVSLIPSIVTLVHDVETMAGGGNGAQKAAAVTEAANTVLNATVSSLSGGAQTSVAPLAPMISTLIDSTVAVANAAGVFTHSTSSVTAASTS